MTDTAKPIAKPIRRGLFRIVNVICECGGELRIEHKGRGEYKWETFCTKCLQCDPNGWPTIKKALRNAQEYFA